MKKLRLSVMLVLCLACMLFALPALAAETVLKSGTTVDNFGYKVIQRGEDIFTRITGYSGTKYGPTVPSYVLGYRVLEIADDAFAGNTRLTDVVLPSTLKTIGARAFKGCTGLVMLTMPSSVREIGESAFELCINLGDPTLETYDFQLGAGVTTIGENAFAGCSRIDTLSIPASVRTIGDGAFSACLRLKQVDFAAGVTSIGAMAFSGCAALKEISLPTSVTGVGHSAFSSCTSLESVTLRSMGETGMYAFSSCTALKDVAIGAGIATLSVGTFSGCNVLSTLTIPPTVTDVGANAVPTATEIRGVSGSAAETYAQENGNIFTAVSESDFPNLIGDYTIEADVLTGYAGEGGDLVIPYGVHAIADDVFSGNTAITSIVIPDGVMVIGANVFKNCTKLTSVTLPHSLTAIGDYAFYGCSRLTGLTLPDAITTLGTSPFRSATTLYCNAQSQTALTLGQSNLSFCAPGDSSATYKASLAADGTRVVTLTGLSLGTKTDVVIPEGVTNIGSLFRGNTSITSVSFPSTLKTVGYEAFYGCTALKTVTFADGLETLGESAFENCTALSSVSVPGSLKSIGASAFAYCTSLDTILLPDNVTFVGQYAFYKSSSVQVLPLCSASCETGVAVTAMGTGWVYSTPEDPSLTLQAVKDDAGNIKVSLGSSSRTAETIIVPEGVTQMSMYAVSDNRNLTTLILPQSLETMSYSCIRSCPKLTKIVMPDNLKSIDSGALYGFYPWPKLYCKPDSNTALLLTNLKKTIYAIGEHDVTISTTKDENGVYTAKALSISTDATDITMPDGITHVNGSFFSGMTQLVSVSFPDSVQEIGGNAFSGCTSLTSVKLPAGLTQIESSLFSGCTALAQIDIPDNVTLVDSWAFQNCTALTQLALPDSVTEIGYAAFEGCTALEQLELSDALTTLSGSVFSGCTALKTLVLPDNITSLASNAFTGCAADIFCRGLNSPTALSLTSSKGSFRLISAPQLTYRVTKSSDVYTVTLTKCDADAVRVTVPEETTAIGSSAFSGCTLLEEIVLPDTLTSIASSAFTNCSAKLIYTPLSQTGVAMGSNFKDPDYPLLSMRVHNGSEGYYAVLSGCDVSAVEITIPDYVTQIGYQAFNGCTLLEKLVLHDNITSISQQAFYYNCKPVVYCSISSQTALALGSINGDSFIDPAYPALRIDSINYYDNTHAFEIVGCDTSAADIVIPDEITKIGSNAFESCALLERIVLPDGITSIDRCAFKSCTALEHVTLPASLTALPEYLFSGCSALKTVELPKGITAIGSGAFSGCAALEQLTLPAGVTSIGSSAFSDCTALTEMIIPEGVTTLEKRLFYGCTSLAKLSLPDGITTLGEYVFSDCTALTPLVLPDGITSVNSSAFYGYGRLPICGVQSTTALTLSSSSKNYAAADAPYLALRAKKNSDGSIHVTIQAQNSDKTREDIVVPEGVTHIPSSWHYYNQILRSVSLPDSLISIGSGAFTGCRNLTQLIIPKGIASLTSTIGESSGIEYVILPKELTAISGAPFGSKLHTVFCYAGSAADTWAQEKGLTIVYLDGKTPGEYTSILGMGDVRLTVGTPYTWSGRLSAVPSPGGACTFACTSSDPETAQVDGGVITFLRPGTVTLTFTLEELPGAALSVQATGYAQPQGLTLPQSLKRIASRAFYGLSVESIILPDGVTDIDRYAFSGCESLTAIYIPASVTSISNQAFTGSDQVVIYAPEGSTAQSYAKTYSIPFVIAQ